MKKFVSVLLMVSVMVMSCIPAYAGLSKPTKTKDLSSEKKYEFEGEAEVSTLYSNYLFTGVKRVEISVNNYSEDDKLKVQLYEKDAWFFSESSEKVPADGSSTWKVKGLDEDSEYYLKFSAPSDFSGYIKSY